jgi:hypothetical protein
VYTGKGVAAMEVNLLPEETGDIKVSRQEIPYLRVLRKRGRNSKFLESIEGGYSAETSTTHVGVMQHVLAI